MNATQIVGLAAFVVTALLCAQAARRSSVAAGFWGGMAGLYALLSVDMALDLRMDLRRGMVQAAKAAGDYGARREVQPILLGLLALGVVVGLALLARRLRGAGARLALLGAAATLAVVGTEVISLHRVDAMLYRPIGPVMAIAWAWSASAALVCLGALRAARR
ncbi:hypothetical protein [Albimonas pacifica]|uniref:Uncharacterized protein n=1 Tax=Albimonas pacifica TaxID=1114924 RepID=A0A1I3C3Q8_9RHOB|nr:hypothetical protein [Albimonas pacifica]SFH69080.1 hypothetical protein SAMN05216258_101550 [Albimonas pacifica]